MVNTTQWADLSPARKALGFFIIGAVIWFANQGPDQTPEEKRINILGNNLSNICSNLIAPAKIANFSRWDYDLTRESYSAITKNATFVLTHEKVVGDYIKCLYNSENNTTEWNTKNASGVYSLDKDFAITSKSF